MMQISDLSTGQLRQFDAHCLEFEQRLRREPESRDNPEPLIHSFLQACDPSHVDLLREELTAIAREIISEESDTATSVSAPFGSAALGAISNADIPTLDGVDRSTIASDERSITDFSSDEVVQNAAETLLPAGTRLGPYKVQSLLGRGGMGRVYRGVDERLERQVAIKVIDGKLAGDPARLKRFKAESVTVAGLQHPHIVRLYDVGEHQGSPYAVMELLEGQTVRDRLRQLDGASMPIDELRPIAAQIASALDAAHRRDIIHRDLKPENLFLVCPDSTPCDTASQDDRTAATGSSQTPAATNVDVRLLDFGLSRFENPLVRRDSSLPDNQTASGIVVGTVGYMAPEQARGLPVTKSADLFGFGCVLHECLYGKRAYSGETVAEVFASLLKDDPVGDPDIAAQYPEMAALVEECLNRDPAGRPESAGAIMQRIREMGDRQTTAATSSRRNFLMFGSIATGAAAAASLGGWTLWQSLRPSTLDIDSVAVLPFVVINETDGEVQHGIQSSATATIPDEPSLPTFAPMSKREMREGEFMATILTTELSQIKTLHVVPYRDPGIQQLSIESLKTTGQTLQVQSLLAGTMTLRNGERDVAMWLVDASTGKELPGSRFERHFGSDGLMNTSALAQEFAQKLGQKIPNSRLPTKDAAYRCLIDGQARIDPDSESGLKMAIACFTKSIQHCPNNQEVPQGGQALAQLMLAYRSDSKTSNDLIVACQENLNAVLTYHPSSYEGRLAIGMLDYQLLGNYLAAEPKLAKLADDFQYRWQANMEFGLLQYVLGNPKIAINLVDRAQRLFNTSLSVRLNAALLRFFENDIAGSSKIIDLALDGLLNPRDPSTLQMLHSKIYVSATGAKIDLLEHQQRWK
ncbi:MAG: serine/threonine-protein kinase, partial [Planctomycetota bacterium]